MACRSLAYGFSEPFYGHADSNNAFIFGDRCEVAASPMVAAVAGALAGAVVAPADSVSSRMQQIVGTVKRRGFATAFQRYMAPSYGAGALATSSAKYGSRFLVFCSARNMLKERGVGSTKAGILAGASAGAVETLVFTPIERARMIQLRNALNWPQFAQCSMTGALGPIVPPAATTTVGLASYLWRHHRSTHSVFYRGWSPLLLKKMACGALAFGAIPLIPLDDGFTVGVISGAIATLVTHPFETLNIRMQADMIHGSTMAQTIRCAIAEGGLGTLFEGLWPRLIIGSLSWGFVLMMFSKASPYIEETAQGRIVDDRSRRRREQAAVQRQKQTRTYFPVSGR